MSYLSYEHTIYIVLGIINNNIDHNNNFNETTHVPTHSFLNFVFSPLPFYSFATYV